LQLAPRPLERRDVQTPPLAAHRSWAAPRQASRANPTMTPRCGRRRACSPAATRRRPRAQSPCRVPSWRAHHRERCSMRGGPSGVPWNMRRSISRSREGHWWVPSGVVRRWVGGSGQRQRPQPGRCAHAYAAQVQCRARREPGPRCGGLAPMAARGARRSGARRRPRPPTRGTARRSCSCPGSGAGPWRRVGHGVSVLARPRCGMDPCSSCGR
jgi:hypothetical protein